LAKHLCHFRDVFTNRNDLFLWENPLAKRGSFGAANPVEKGLNRSFLLALGQALGRGWGEK